jgi:hypothetical protein
MRGLPGDSERGENPIMRNKRAPLVQPAIFSYTLSMSNYKIFDHTADIGVEVTGRTRKALFVNTADQSL